MLPIQWVQGALSSGVKRSRREADHPSPTSAEIKTAWIYTTTPPYFYAFTVWCLVMLRENFNVRTYLVSFHA
jgi:hypothetical protein